jgi:integrase
MNDSNLPYLNSSTIKRGDKTYIYWYFRKDGIQLRIHGEYGSPEFLINYNALLLKHSQKPKTKRVGQFGMLINQYYESTEFRTKKQNTKFQYQHYMDHIYEILGEYEIEHIRKSVIKAYLSRFDAKPATYNNILRCFRILMNFAIDEEIIEHSAADRIKQLSTGSHKAWKYNELTKFLSSNEVSKELKDAVSIGVFTSLRISNCLSIKRTEIANGMIRYIPVKQKGNDQEEREIPIFPWLQKVIDGIEEKSDYLLTSPSGKPWTYSNFKRAFREARLKLDLMHLAFHGLRTTGLVLLAEAGCTAKEIQAISAHKNLETLEIYVSQAANKKLGKNAMMKLGKDADIISFLTGLEKTNKDQ